MERDNEDVWLETSGAVIDHFFTLSLGLTGKKNTHTGLSVGGVNGRCEPFALMRHQMGKQSQNHLLRPWHGSSLITPPDFLLIFNNGGQGWFLTRECFICIEEWGAVWGSLNERKEWLGEILFFMSTAVYTWCWSRNIWGGSSHVLKDIGLWVISEYVSFSDTWMSFRRLVIKNAPGDKLVHKSWTEFILQDYIYYCTYYYFPPFFWKY